MDYLGEEFVFSEKLVFLSRYREFLLRLRVCHNMLVLSLVFKNKTPLKRGYSSYSPFVSLKVTAHLSAFKLWFDFCSYFCTHSPSRNSHFTFICSLAFNI